MGWGEPLEKVRFSTSVECVGYFTIYEGLHSLLSLLLPLRDDALVPKTHCGIGRVALELALSPL